MFPCLGWQGPLGALPGCVKVHTGSYPHPCKLCFIYILMCTMKPFILTALCLLGVTVAGDQQDSTTPTQDPGAQQGLGGVSIPRLAAVLAVTSPGPHCSEGTPSPEQQSRSCAHRGLLDPPACPYLSECRSNCHPGQGWGSKLRRCIFRVLEHVAQDGKLHWSTVMREAFVMHPHSPQRHRMGSEARACPDPEPRGVGKKARASPSGQGCLPPSEGFPSSLRFVARSLEPTFSNLLNSVAQNGCWWGGTPESPCSRGAGDLVQAQGSRVLWETVGVLTGRKGTWERDHRVELGGL